MVWGCGTKNLLVGFAIDSGTFLKRDWHFCFLVFFLSFVVSVSLFLTLLYGTYYVYFYSL